MKLLLYFTVHGYWLVLRIYFCWACVSLPSKAFDKCYLYIIVLSLTPGVWLQSLDMSMLIKDISIFLVLSSEEVALVSISYLICLAQAHPVCIWKHTPETNYINIKIWYLLFAYQIIWSGANHLLNNWVQLQYHMLILSMDMLTYELKCRNNILGYVMSL